MLGMLALQESTSTILKGVTPRFSTKNDIRFNAFVYPQDQMDVPRVKVMVSVGEKTMEKEASGEQTVCNRDVKGKGYQVK
jgi:hypothetical protein